MYKSLIRVLLAGVLLIILMKVLFIDVYYVETASMAPTIWPNEFVLAWRLKSLKVLSADPISRHDVIVFKQPDYNEYKYLQRSVTSVSVVKRCVFFPGDTVLLKRPDTEALLARQDSMFYNKEVARYLANQPLFPHSNKQRWSVNNYGPLYVPAAGNEIEMSADAIELYKEIIAYENKNTLVANNAIYIDGERILRYIFKENYYFVVGDNFYHSIDSRYWGFLPEQNIVGKYFYTLRF